MKCHSTQDWTLAALITKRGSSGRSCSVAPWNSMASYAPDTRSLMRPGSRLPTTTAFTSTVLLAIARSGRTIFHTKSLLRLSGSKLSSPHFKPSRPAVIEPPDTLEILLIPPSRRASYSRHSTPMWKTIARYPPPDRHSAAPSSAFRSSASVGIASTGASVIEVFHTDLIADPLPKCRSTPSHRGADIASEQHAQRSTIESRKLLLSRWTPANGTPGAALTTKL
jgi:hypothetical protein